jgi:hypothetical protein
MRVALASLIGFVMIAAVACKKAAEPKAEIQSAIEAHLQQRQNLMLANMTLEVGEVKITGDTAQAEVKFRSKQKPDLVVAVQYTLHRQGDRWQVESSTPTSGMGVSPHGGMATAPEPASEQPLKSSH